MPRQKMTKTHRDKKNGTAHEAWVKRKNLGNNDVNLVGVELKKLKQNHWRRDFLKHKLEKGENLTIKQMNDAKKLGLVETVTE